MRMSIFSFEHSALSYRADFVFYLLAVLLLASFVGWSAPADQALRMVALICTGLMVWSWLEYVLHRYVLHGVEPFASWHREHHRRPAALVGASTALSAALLSGLVLLPAWWWLGRLNASALFLGVVAGYLGYTATHHAVHHGVSRRRVRLDWIQDKTRWHAQHHQLPQPCCFGVTTRLWDHLLGTAARCRSKAG